MIPSVRMGMCAIRFHSIGIRAEYIHVGDCGSASIPTAKRVITFVSTQSLENFWEVHTTGIIQCLYNTMEVKQTSMITLRGTNIATDALCQTDIIKAPVQQLSATTPHKHRRLIPRGLLLDQMLRYQNSSGL